MYWVQKTSSHLCQQLLNSALQGLLNACALKYSTLCAPAFICFYRSVKDIYQGSSHLWQSIIALDLSEKALRFEGAKQLMNEPVVGKHE